MAGRPHLLALADKIGVLPEYTDIEGTVHHTANDSRVMLLEAMGYAAATEDSAARSMRELNRKERERLLPPVTVVRQSELPRHQFRGVLPERFLGHPAVCGVIVRDENDRLHRCECEIADGEFAFRAPGEIGTGYHTLHLAVRQPGRDVHTEHSLIVVPDRCFAVEQLTSQRKLFGICANLYTIRSDRDWGVGDFGDLGRLTQWAGAQGAAFVGLNPLHAVRNIGHDISPYAPLSRLYRNVIYLDIPAVPEFERNAEARAHVQSANTHAALAARRNADRVEYESILRLKLAVMRILHAQFAANTGDPNRREAYAFYVEQQGEALERFATFSVLESHLCGQGYAHGLETWPEQYRNPGSPAVDEFRRARSGEIDFHKYVQFELDRQLAHVGDNTRGCGMSIGLYQDLAIGTAPGGADTWAFPDLFVSGARVGAPPDDYSRTGQDWGLPPIHPIRLREDGYRYWRRLLQANLAHSGALRIDHVMGLLRQYWIPPGANAMQGAYVRYPADDLFGILALESHRHHAAIIGEDLGTVPAGFSELLAKWGVLSCKVLQFERDGAGNYRPPHEYSDRALATSTTHDHPSLASFWRGDDLTLRRKVGSTETDEHLEVARKRRATDRKALLRALGLDEQLADADIPYEELCAAVHRFLSRTPAPLLGLMLDDLTGELEPVNIPGVGPEQHDCWRRRMRMSLEELMRSPAVAKCIGATAERAEHHACPIS